jgi:large subunit ribosomal protein L4e
MNATVYDLKGVKKKEISLPTSFETAYHPDLIKRSVLSMQSQAKQPKGRMITSGMQNSAIMRGKRSLPQNERSINVGHARLPRLKNRNGLLNGRVARVPQSVGGRKTHAPKVEQAIREKINKKERKQALLSAIATTANPILVSARHAVDEKISLPLIVVDDFEKVAKTKDVIATLKALNVYQDIENAKDKRTKRAGKGKKRGRKYKKKVSLLIVTENSSPVYRGARNLEGVDICPVYNLNAELLAPGTVAGRLTIWTESAAAQAGETKTQIVEGVEA